MNNSVRKFRFQKNVRLLLNQITSRLYIDRHRDPGRSVMIAGTARSGTTWLADLFAAMTPSRVLFEPYNPGKVNEISDLHYFQYLRPEDNHQHLFDYTLKVVSGRIRNRWIDRQNTVIFPSRRIIKDVRVNLFLQWFRDHFPKVPVVFILRHPCAVVLSRMELGWATDKDIASFLAQEDLLADHLEKYLDLIRAAKSIEEKHAIIWCVHYLIPLRQFQDNPPVMVYYEDLCVNPEEELKRIQPLLGEKTSPVLPLPSLHPSLTSSAHSAVVAGQNRLSRWKMTLDVQQVAIIMRVVRAFGLDHLYDESLLPIKADVVVNST